MFHDPRVMVHSTQIVKKKLFLMSTTVISTPFLHQFISYSSLFFLFLCCLFWPFPTLNKFLSYSYIMVLFAPFFPSNYYPVVYLPKTIERTWDITKFSFKHCLLFFILPAKYFMQVFYITWKTCCPTSSKALEMLYTLVCYELGLLPWFIHSLPCPYKNGVKSVSVF